jgi:outer membrane lipase/esterase
MMNKRLLSVLVGATLAGTAALPAQATQFTGMVIFGDSLSDGGFYRRVLGLPSAVGRFTTNPGLTAAEVIGQRYGFTTAPSNTGGTNFAQGGARVAQPAGPSLTPPGAAERPVSTQIREYLTANGGRADPNALYSMWAGANDIFFNLGAVQAGLITPAQLSTAISTAATDMVTQVATLKAAGARYVIVYTIPNIGITPQFTGPLASTVTQLTAGYNLGLFVGLKAAGVEVIPVDTFTLLNEIRADFARYGFTNVTTPACLPVGSSSLTCSPANYAAANANNTYLFADGVHPSSAAHKILGDFVVAMIEAPANMGMLAESGLRARESHMRSVGQGFTGGFRGNVGKLTAFASVDGGKYDYSATNAVEGVKNDLRSFSAGLTFRASEGTVVGVAVGKSEADASFTGGLGGYTADETAVSFFGGGSLGGAYFRGMMSIGDLKYDSIRRNVVLGQVTRVASGSAGGSNFSSAWSAGWDFRLGGVSVGPFAGLVTQNVDVNDFYESGAGSANLRYEKQNRKSKVSSLGVRGYAVLGNFIPYARLSFEKEHNNRERMVTATPYTFVTNTGNSYSIPTYRGDDAWGTLALGVNGKFTERISGGIAYSSVFSRANVKADALSAGLTVAF